MRYEGFVGLRLPRPGFWIDDDQELVENCRGRQASRSVDICRRHRDSVAPAGLEGRVTDRADPGKNWIGEADAPAIRWQLWFGGRCGLSLAMPGCSWITH